jgi:hypothetical protein
MVKSKNGTDSKLFLILNTFLIVVAFLPIYCFGVYRLSVGLSFENWTRMYNYRPDLAIMGWVFQLTLILVLLGLIVSNIKAIYRLRNSNSDSDVTGVLYVIKLQAAILLAVCGFTSIIFLTSGVGNTLFGILLLILCFMQLFYVVFVPMSGKR